MLEEFLWVQKYRPRTISDCILPEELKKTFQEYVDQGEVPTLLLSGPPGVGKTTVALAMLDELNIDYIMINGSMNGNIDTLRTEISQFASSVSFTGNRKMVIIDESDYLNCLDESELVKLSDGSLIRLSDMDPNKRYEVVSFNTKTKTFEPNMAEVVNKTTKMVYQIELDCGKVINCTEDHPLICEDENGKIVTRTISEGLYGYKIIVEI